MTITLAAAMLYLAKTLGGVQEGTATGGSTTTLIDTSREEQAEYWAGGTLFGLSGNNAGTALVIQQYNDAGVIHVAAQSSPFVAGNMYALSSPKFTKAKLRMAINRALVSMPVLKTNETLITVVNQDEYVLPAGVSNLLRVDIAASATAPFMYQQIYRWYEIAGRLCFKNIPAPGFRIKLTFRNQHPEVVNDAELLLSGVDIEWMTWRAAINAYRDLISEQKKDDAGDIELMNEAIRMEMQEKIRVQGSWNNSIQRSSVLG